MARYNKELMKIIEDMCSEGEDSIKEVGSAHYEMFIGFSDNEMDAIIRQIVVAQLSHINKSILSGKWKTGDEIFDFIMMFLEMLAEGRMAFSEDGERLLFLKPVGEPPSEDMDKKIENKIEGSRGTIERVIRGLLSDQKKSKGAINK